MTAVCLTIEANRGLAEQSTTKARRLRTPGGTQSMICNPYASHTQAFTARQVPSVRQHGQYPVF